MYKIGIFRSSDIINLPEQLNHLVGKDYLQEPQRYFQPLYSRGFQDFQLKVVAEAVNLFFVGIRISLLLRRYQLYILTSIVISVGCSSCSK